MPGLIIVVDIHSCFDGFVILSAILVVFLRVTKASL